MSTFSLFCSDVSQNVWGSKAGTPTTGMQLLPQTWLLSDCHGQTPTPNLTNQHGTMRLSWEIIHLSTNANSLIYWEVDFTRIARRAEHVQMFLETWCHIEYAFSIFLWISEALKMQMKREEFDFLHIISISLLQLSDYIHFSTHCYYLPKSKESGPLPSLTSTTS